MVALDFRRTPYYRPVSVLWWALLHNVLALGAAGFHASSILLHATTSALVFLLARRLLFPAGALTAGLLFAVRPVHVEPVAFASAGATELLPSALFIATLLALSPPAGRHGGPAVPGEFHAWSAALLALAALLSKETAVVLPLLAALILSRNETPAPCWRYPAWRTPARRQISAVPSRESWSTTTTS